MIDPDLFEKAKPAFKHFSDQLSTLIPKLRLCLDRLAETDDTEEARNMLLAQADELEKEFHLLKGGAGFLKFEKIAARAKEAEQRFKVRDFTAKTLTAFKRELENLLVLLDEQNTELTKHLSE